MYDVIVVGGGAAGLMAAATSSFYGKNTLVIEKNDEVGRKILITGKGRCNVTNNCDNETLLKNIVHNSKFMYSAFNNFSSADTMSYFETLGVELKTERGNRVFPVSDKAADIRDCLFENCKNLGVKFIKDVVAQITLQNNSLFEVKTKNDKLFKSSSVIIATGGITYKKTGSSGDGYVFAKKFGHNIVSPKASLVALKTEGDECSKMQGLSLKNTKIKLIDKQNGKVVYEDMGEMLFAHFGVSGPIVLSASAYIDKEPNLYKISLDLKPALSESQLDSRIRRDFEGLLNKDFSNSLGALLPKTLIPIIINRSNISPDLKVNQITKEQRKALISVIKELDFNIIGTASLDTAIITRGGVSTKEINPKTMESKLVKGLYFAGEVIDVDACTGGFNLQIAFSTGYTAGLNA